MSEGISRRKRKVGVERDKEADEVGVAARRFLIFSLTKCLSRPQRRDFGDHRPVCSLMPPLLTPLKPPTLNSSSSLCHEAPDLGAKGHGTLRASEKWGRVDSEKKGRREKAPESNVVCLFALPIDRPCLSHHLRCDYSLSDYSPAPPGTSRPRHCRRRQNPSRPILKRRKTRGSALENGMKERSKLFSSSFSPALFLFRSDQERSLVVRQWRLLS